MAHQYKLAYVSICQSDRRRDPDLAVDDGRRDAMYMNTIYTENDKKQNKLALIILETRKA